MFFFKLRIAICEESLCLKFIVKVELHNKTSDANEKNTTSLTREMSPLGKRADVLIKSLKKKAQVNFPHKKKKNYFESVAFMQHRAWGREAGREIYNQ